MKLCIIGNPNSIHTRRWANWLIERGHKVWLLADVKPEKRWKQAVDFVLPGRFTPPVIKFLVWEIKTLRILQGLQPDILHAHRVSSAGWIAAFSGFHPFVVTPWGSDLYQHPYRSRMAARLARYVLNRADLVTASSQDLCNQAIIFGADPQKTHLIGWGVDMRVFNSNQASCIRTELNIGIAPVVLSIRAVKPIYNLDVIIKAIPMVRAAIPTVVFTFQQYNKDSNYKIYLERLIESMGLRQSVRWLDEFEVWEKVVDAYHMATIAVSIASSDSMPISVQEAMACGVPVITSNLPSIREWITPEINGLMVPPRDEHALASAIIRLLNDPELLASFRQKNAHMVMERANQQMEMEKVEELYLNLLQKRGTEA